jgi:hypothetical protein
MTNDYAEATSVEATRRRGTFSNMSFSKARLGASAGEEVTFDFTLSDYEEGMTVNVELDRLEPADGALTRVAYVYTPTSANCSIKLKTAVASSGICGVTLSADYYDPSAKQTIEQSDIKTITIARTNAISFDWNGQQGPNKAVISVANATVTVGRTQFEGKWNNRTVYFENLQITGSGLTDSTPVTIVVSRGNTQKTINTTIGELQNS